MAWKRARAPTDARAPSPRTRAAAATYGPRRAGRSRVRVARPRALHHGHERVAVARRRQRAGDDVVEDLGARAVGRDPRDRGTPRRLASTTCAASSQTASAPALT